MHLAAESLVML